MYQFLCLYNMIIYNELVKNTGTTCIWKPERAETQ